MALADDLLAQATYLATREPRKPKQASLRRAVSAGYYALFHLLVAAGAQSLAPARPALLRSRVGRAFSHADMNNVCKRFQPGGIPSSFSELFANPIEPEFKQIADAFVELQQARHSADYDTSEVFERPDVLQEIDMVEQAFVAWKHVRTTENAASFLAALLLSRYWKGGA